MVTGLVIPNHTFEDPSLGCSVQFVHFSYLQPTIMFIVPFHIP